MLYPPGARLDLHQRHGGLVLCRPADGQVDPGRQLDRSAAQADPQRLLCAGQPCRLERRPTMAQSIGLALDLGAQFLPIGGRQSLDPRDQLPLTVIDREGSQPVGHGVVDGAHGDQLSKEGVDEDSAGHGDRRRAFAELVGHVVGFAGQHAGEPVLGHHDGSAIGTPPLADVEGESAFETVSEPARQLPIGLEPGPPSDP